MLNDEERTICVSNCKFVDAVEPNCPYVMNEEYLNRMIEKWDLVQFRLMRVSHKVVFELRLR